MTAVKPLHFGDVAQGDHVDVQWIAWAGDEDPEIRSLDGWVSSVDEHMLVIANTPDWRDLEPVDYFEAAYRWADVTVWPVVTP